MSEKHRHFLKECDWVGKGLMFEPSGHNMMSGSMLYSTHNPENDFAILVIETSGCPPMYGYGTIDSITIVLGEDSTTPVLLQLKMDLSWPKDNLSFCYLQS